MIEPLRIVHCFRSPVGGIFRHVRDLSDALVAAGHEVGVVCDSTTGGAFEDALFDGMKGRFALGVHRTPMQRHVGPGDLTAAVRIYRLMKTLKPDIIHGHGAKGGVYARIFGTMMRTAGCGPARLYSPHGGSLHYDENTARGRFFFASERVMDRFTDHLLFVSDYERRAFRRKIGGPRAPSSLVYNGLGAAEFCPVAPYPDAADFLFVGMMRDLKGPDIFIDALAAAGRELGRPLSAAMVGAGQDKAKYVEQARRLGIFHHVRFFEPMPAREAFALARTIVVPSRAEAMPYIVLEALAAGVPTIASAVGGIPEIFPAGSPALIAPDVAELASRMASVLSDEASFRAAMPGAAALKARFSAEAMSSGIEEIYAATLRKMRRRSDRMTVPV